MRGNDRFGHFDLEPEPVGNLDLAARASHAAIYKRYRESDNEQRAWHEAGRILPES